MKLSMQVGLGPAHIVLDRHPVPQTGVAPFQLSAHISFDQMAAWIKMAVAVGVGLGPGDFVFDGDPAAPPQKEVSLFTAPGVVTWNDRYGTIRK